MQQVSLAELKKLTVAEMQDGPCLRVMADGDFLFYAIMQPQGEMRTRIEGIASLIDASRGVKAKEPPPITGDPIAVG